MSEPLLIAILGGNTTLLVAVIGFLGVYIRRNGGKPEAKAPDSWNGEERRKNQAARYYMECPHVAKFETGIESIRGDLSGGLQEVRGELGRLRADMNTHFQQERR